VQKLALWEKRRGISEKRAKKSSLKKTSGRQKGGDQTHVEKQGWNAKRKKEFGGGGKKPGGSCLGGKKNKEETTQRRGGNPKTGPGG